MPTVTTSRSAFDFATDTNVKYPRFQRGSVWSPGQKFSLCLSLFHRLPCGAVVVRKEAPLGGSSLAPAIRLLDGRQRREAFQGMLQPSAIYGWAKTVLDLRSEDSASVVSAKYWRHITDWLGDEVPERSVKAADKELVEDVTVDDEEQSDDSTAERDPAFAQDPEPAEHTYSRAGFADLLEVLKLCHGAPDGHNDPFAAFFDFSEFGVLPPYMKTVDGAHSVQTDVLAQRLRQMLEDGAPTQESVFIWLQGDRLAAAEQVGLRQRLDQNWTEIATRVAAISTLVQLLRQTDVSYIELTNTSSLEEMKVFFLVNKGGTPLTYPEILSAKADWNRPVIEPSEELVAAQAYMYKGLGLEVPTDVCRWDVAATLTKRLDSPLSLGKSPSRPSQQRIKLGFELLSGYFHPEGDVTKGSYGDLASKYGDAIPWSTMTFPGDLSGCEAFLLEASPHLSRWRDWGQPLGRVLPKFAVLNFMLLTAKDWIRHGRPTGLKGKGRTFRKESARLLDRLLYETLEGSWGSAGDHRVKYEQKRFAEGDFDYLFQQVPVEQWTQLLERMLKGQVVSGRPLKEDKIDGRVQAMLRYFHVLSGAKPPSNELRLDWDHIVPQAAFEGEPAEVRKRMNQGWNLALLPHRKNRAKGELRLNECTDELLRKDIVAYEGIPEKDFGKYSDLSGLDALQSFRTALILQAFGAPRETALS